MSRTLGLLLFLGLLVLAALLVGRPWDGSDGAAQPTPAERASATEHDDEALTLKGVPTRPAPAPPASAASAPLGPPSGYVLDRTAPPPFLRALPPAPPTPKMRVRGRLLEPDGTPAARALVDARSVTGADANHILLIGGFPSDDLGRFEVSAQQAAEIELWVWSERSAPTVLPRQVSPAVGVDLGDIVLPGGLALGGRLLVAGRPSPYGPFEVHVMRAGATGVMGSLEWGVVLDAEGHPLSASRIVTADADGTWKLEGLSPGTYTVRIQDLEGVQLHDALLPSAPRVVTAPARGIDFDLPASLLAVAFPGTSVFLARTCHVEVTAAAGPRTRIWNPQERGLQEPLDLRAPGVEAGDSLLLVPAETALEVWVQADGLEGWRTNVVSARAGEVLRVTPAQREAQKGWIKLRRDPDARGHSSVVVHVTVPGSEALVHEQAVWLPAPDFTAELELPLGTWNVELRPDGPQQGSDAELFLPQTRRVEVGATLLKAPELIWAPPHGGRLRLRVEAQRAAQRPVTCTLLREGQPAETPEWRAVFEGGGVARLSVWVMPTPLVAGVRMDTDGALAPGGARLRLECDGFEPHEEPVVIRPGETTDVTVRLTPR